MWSKPLLEPEGLQATWLPLAFVSHNLNPHGSSLSLGLLSEAGRQLGFQGDPMACSPIPQAALTSCIPPSWNGCS